MLGHQRGCEGVLDCMLLCTQQQGSVPGVLQVPLNLQRASHARALRRREAVRGRQRIQQVQQAQLAVQAVFVGFRHAEPRGAAEQFIKGCLLVGFSLHHKAGQVGSLGV
jgi:hypothetical protein